MYDICYMVGRSLLKQGEKLMSTKVLEAVEAHSLTIGLDMVSKFARLFKSQEQPLKALMQAGNLKIPKETAIFNMSSAEDCVSLAMGKCNACVMSEDLKKLKTICYAMKAERQYPFVLPYRQRQEKFWLDVTAEDFVIQFVIINSIKRNKFNKIRFNEAGDFHDQAGLDKADKIAKLLLNYGVEVYCYTSRDDLDFTKVKTLVVNRSMNSKFDYDDVDGLDNAFMMITKEEGADHKKWPKGYAKCPADCRICDRCSIKGKKTFIIEH